MRSIERDGDREWLLEYDCGITRRRKGRLNRAAGFIPH
jgi:hypothetical protein